MNLKLPYAIAGHLGNRVDGARMAAFAGGGILAMLSDSLIPFAHERLDVAPVDGRRILLGPG